MNIEIAGPPERTKNIVGDPIRLPLTNEPDPLLFGALAESKPVKGFVHSFQADGASLLLLPTPTGRKNLGPMLTAVQTMIEATNNTRAVREQQAEEVSEAAKVAGREQEAKADAELAEWYAQNR